MGLINNRNPEGYRGRKKKINPVNKDVLINP